MSDPVSQFLDRLEGVRGRDGKFMARCPAHDDRGPSLSIGEGDRGSVLIHCFAGSNNFAKRLLDLNCYISVSGIITFKKSAELANVVSSIPIENLLVETDSPYLAPDPLRGKINEPSYIIHTIDKLSKIKKLSKEVVIEYTTNNFKRLFSVT